MLKAPVLLEATFTTQRKSIWGAQMLWARRYRVIVHTEFLLKFLIISM